ncbi:MAG TPA: type VI secretion system contractile sheath large subunit [Rhodopila sp.]|uniref:type VI secretion system contractile sheath domain-containing protein n=1 Tax=Rhodopila sp. TaxID=2480087 RepID=UPI002CFE8050|nr:type VI secretion system contractile sheath large subunit [Rhodopila sp.]HVY17421.1 type VI secretion system contractile sheath large subunit [Rhodopila sp.]
MQYEVSFGRIGNVKRVAPGPAFRLAVLGDFSGRANAGIVQTGSDLAGRKPIKVDVDNLDTVIERLDLTVQVALGGDSGVVNVPIRSMDDFHPDQLAENLSLFEEMMTLRRNLGSKAGFDRAAKEVLSWAGEEALTPLPRRARGASVATDRRLSDFARLTGIAPQEEAEADDLIRRLIGPYIQPAKDSRQDALVARVDTALSDAMRRVLHNPDFQITEALWRGVEFLVRSIETDARMQIVLYDISAEELAADLASADALEETGLYSLLVEQPALDAGQGPLSMLAGLYQFEATPPHADLLGRIAQVAAAAGAPFVTAVGSDPLRTPMHDWHPLTKQAWEGLRGLPASVYLALLTPRYLLRMPYGKKTDPIDAFAFEEFTRQSGLSGMLWGHPALLFANRAAASWRREGAKMKLGSQATVGDLPVYVYQDTDGEQIALSCTERLFTERVATQIAGTGVNPVIALRGRPEVRIGGFLGASGQPLAGRWNPVEVKLDGTSSAAPPPPPPAPEPVAEVAPEPVEDEAAADETVADDTAAEETAAEEPAAEEAAPEPAAEEPAAEEPAAEAPAGLDDLDALLASLNTDAAPPPAAEAPDAMDADLDALLASLK